MIDQLHTELARQGHPDVRPAHGFAMQAIGAHGATTGELGQRLGVSKQAAGKTVDRLEALGYVQRTADTSDARRKLVRLSPRGMDALTRSAAIFEDLRAGWVRERGSDRIDALEDTLRAVVGTDALGLDAPGWLGS